MNTKTAILALVLKGTPADVIINTLDSDETRAVADIQSLMRFIERAQYFKRTAERKAFWYLSVLRRLRHIRGDNAIREISDPIEPSQFFDSYFFQNKPLILRNISKYWWPFAEWTFPKLAERFGDTAVEIMDGRRDDRDHEFAPHHYLKKLPLRDYIHRVTSEDTNSCYMIAQSNVLANALLDLYRSITPLPGILTLEALEKKKAGQFLWMGPKGTITNLHHDISNVLYVQVIGTKHFVLYSPEDTCFLYNHRGYFSEVDVRQPDHERHPLLAYAEKLELTLSAGDALFLPVGWWHFVEALEPSLSISFTNFVHDNIFPYPEHELENIYPSER